MSARSGAMKLFLVRNIYIYFSFCYFRGGFAETFAVSGSRDRTVKLWGNLRQPHQHKLLASLKSHEHTITCVQLAPSVVLSSSWDKTVVSRLFQNFHLIFFFQKVWDIDHQSLLHTLRGHEDWIWVVQLADDNKTAVRYFHNSYIDC